jgi:hypothetical protein
MEWAHLEAVLLESWPGGIRPVLDLLVGFCIAASAVWLLLSWRYRDIVSTLRARLKAADAQVRAYEDGLGGLTPTEAASRLRRAEAYLASLPPRRLSEEQRRAIALASCPPVDAPRLAVIYDPASGEINRYAHDFVEAFAAAPGWNVVDERFPLLPRAPALGIGVGLADLGHPTPTEQLVIGALSDAGVAYDVVPRSLGTVDAEIVVSGRAGNVHAPHESMLNQ